MGPDNDILVWFYCVSLETVEGFGKWGVTAQI